MPSPIVPNTVKEAIPTPGGSFCTKMGKFLSIPTLLWRWANYMWTEDGAIRTGANSFGNDVCQLDCFGGGTGEETGGGDTFSRPTNVSASDGGFNDKVRVTWTSVVTAVRYDIYRNTSNDSSGATLLGSSVTTEYDDTTPVAGQTYYYWVRALSDSQVSGFSLTDTGWMSDTISAVTDLRASKGAFRFASAAISIEFDPVADATHYDIYRSETSDFADAVLIDGDREPFDSTDLSVCLSRPPGDTKPVFLYENDHLLYIHQPAQADIYDVFYFWVVAKTKTASMTVAVSPESASVSGWAVGFGDGVPPGNLDNLIESGGVVFDIPLGATALWISFWGSGGAGAGGDGNDGGGGGGGAAHGAGKLTGFTPGTSLLRYTSSPEADTGATAASTSGAAGPVSKLEYSADGTFTDTVDLFSAAAPGGGVFTNGGLGAGGSGSILTVDGSVADSQSQDGRDGQAARTGGKGGRSAAAAYRRGSCPGQTITFEGGGANANPSSPVLATGGQGRRGQAYVHVRF